MPNRTPSQSRQVRSDPLLCFLGAQIRAEIVTAGAAQLGSEPASTIKQRGPRQKRLIKMTLATRGLNAVLVKHGLGPELHTSVSLLDTRSSVALAQMTRSAAEAFDVMASK